MTILIAGAGPAGTFLADNLARHGHKIILVEKLKDPSENAFSSAAVPLETISKFKISPVSISSFWNNWNIFGPDGEKYQWSSSSNQGCVIDFGLFRKELWQNALDSGVDILLGWKVIQVKSFTNYALVELISPDGIKSFRKVNLVVDATGCNRSLLSTPIKGLVTGTGIEWILRVEKDIHIKWHKALSFFIGSSWVKYGYGWVFPMSKNRIKVGVCRLPPANNRQKLSNINDLRNLLIKINLSQFTILDKHGGVINSTVNRSEPHFKGRIIGVGDSISTSNLLGGEGIRFSLLSAELLGKHLLSFLRSDRYNYLDEFNYFKSYKKSVKSNLGYMWHLSNKIGIRTWSSLDNLKSDKRLIALLNTAKSSLRSEDLSELLFKYRFEKYFYKLIPYILGFK